MDQKQWKELNQTIAGGALFIGGFIGGGVMGGIMADPWWKAGLLAGMLLAVVGLWMMLHRTLKRWWNTGTIREAPPEHSEEKTGNDT